MVFCDSSLCVISAARVLTYIHIIMTCCYTEYYSCFLSGFDRYKGGLDTVHDLTGHHSVFTQWRGIEIMFHVSTLLPFEQNDPQKVNVSRREITGTTYS